MALINNDLSKNSINLNQMHQLPRQLIKCPASIPNIEPFDHKTGLTTDDYLRGEWNGQDKHYMMNVALRVKLINTKTINLTDGGTRMITNVLASNDGIFEVHIRAWEPYAEKLSGLLANTVYLFSNLYVREPGNIIYGNTGYLLSFHGGSIVRKIVRQTKNTKKILPIQDTI